MDPLSITTAVTGLISLCLKTAVQLDGLRSKYQNAGNVVAALCSESTVFSAGLAQMQTLLTQNSSPVRSSEDLLTTFDAVLTSCLVVFTCLERETEKLALAGSGPQSKLTWIMRARLVWKDDKMKEYLSLVRGQQASLSFLIQLLQLQSVDEVYRQVERQGETLRKQAARAESLRKANPSTHIPASLFRARRPPVYSEKAEDGDLIDLGESAPHPASDPAFGPLPPPSWTVSTEWKPSPDVKPLEIHPREVAFERPLTHNQPTRLVLRNPNPGRVIFKVSTTAPTKYCVRPNHGSLDAGQTVEVVFEMMAWAEEPPADLVSRDKFLIQSMAVARGREFGSQRVVSDAIRDTRTPGAVRDRSDSRDPKTFVQEKKMRVVFLPAKGPRLLSVKDGS